MNWKLIVVDLLIFAAVGITCYIAGLARGSVLGATEMWHNVHDEMLKKGVHICDVMTPPEKDGQ